VASKAEQVKTDSKKAEVQTAVMEEATKPAAKKIEKKTKPQEKKAGKEDCRT